MTKNLETSPQAFKGKVIEEATPEGEVTAITTPEGGEMSTLLWRMQEALEDHPSGDRTMKTGTGDRIQVQNPTGKIKNGRMK